MKTFKTGYQSKWLLFLVLVLLPAISFGQIKLSQSMSPGGTFGLVDVNELKGGVMMVDSLELRESIFMNRTKRGLMVVVIDADSIQAGDQTKTYMFLPSEDPTDYTDGGKVWNTYDEFPVHTVAEFRAKYGLNPWVEVSLGLKDPNGPGIDSIFISTSFIDTIFSNTGDTLFLMDKVKTDSLYADYLNLSGIQILGISTDETFVNASNDSLATQLAIKTFVEDMFAAFSENANINNLVVDTLTVDTAFISMLRNETFVSDSINVDTLIAVYSETDTASIDKLGINYFTLSGYWIASISNDTTFASADSTSLITEYAVQTRIDSVLEYVDGQFSALSQNMIEDTQDGETMVKVTDGDSLIIRIANDTTVVIDPNKNVTFTDATIVLNGDSIYEVADRGESFANRADSAKAVTSLATVDSMIAESGDNINFAFGDKKITRAGWSGVSGNSVNATNLEDFLQKLFFPMPAPVINSFGTPAQSTQTVDVNGNITSSVGTITIPYATWVADAGITFDFDVDNRTDAASDPTDELPAQAITSIRVTKGGSDVGTFAIGDGTTDQAGTIAVNAADVTINPTSNSSNVFTLVVEDEYPNTNTLDVNVNMSAARRLTVDYSRVFSAGSNNVLPIKREGSNKTFTYYWSVNALDDTISALEFSDSAEPAITLPSPAYGGVKTGTVSINMPYDISQKTLTIEAQSSIYNNWVTRTSPRAYWYYTCYYGYIPVTGTGDNDTKIQHTVDNVTQATLTSGSGVSSADFENNYFVRTGTGSSNGFEVNYAGQSGAFLAFFLIPKKNNLVDVAGLSYVINLMNPAGIFEAQASATGFKEISFDYGGVTEEYYIVYLETIYEDPSSNIYIRF